MSDEETKGLHETLSVTEIMTANGDARREIAIHSLEVISNLLYLIQTQSDDPLKVTEYATLAATHVKSVAEAFH